MKPDELRSPQGLVSLPEEKASTTMADLHSPYPKPFPTTSVEQWHADAEAGLRGGSFDHKLRTRTHEGIELAPLYTREDVPTPDHAGFPGFAPFTRGNHLWGSAPKGWEIHQPVNHPDPTEAINQLTTHTKRGVQSVWLKPGDSFQLASTIAATPPNGIECGSLADLKELGAAIKASPVPVSVEAGANPLAGLALLVHDTSTGPKNGGALNSDPLGTLATTGSLPGSLKQVYDQLACATAWVGTHNPSLRTITVSTTPYHRAGATAVQELAYGIATGVCYLRELSDRGLPLETLLPAMSFRFSMGRSFFMELAKLRAARMLWGKITEACGMSSGMHIHAETSTFTQTQRDPWVNLLRGTSATFAATAGGANQITTTPFDEALGVSDDFGHRLAAHTQVILAEESHLGAVVDPGGGSSYIESLTTSLAQKAWDLFTELEASGGITGALLNKEVHKSLAATWEEKRRAVEHRQDAITGVNEFPHLDEAPLHRPHPPSPPRSPSQSAEASLPKAQLTALLAAIDECSADALPLLRECLASAGSLQEIYQGLWKGADAVHIPPLPCHRLAEPFEALRDQSDDILLTTGARPRIFLANMGQVPDHKARATFAKNFFEAGGIQTIGNDGYQTVDELVAGFTHSETPIAVICSSDSLYDLHAVNAAKALRQAGAHSVLLAGRPGDHHDVYTAAGIDSFIFLGCNAYKILHDLLNPTGANR